MKRRKKNFSSGQVSSVGSSRRLMAGVIVLVLVAFALGAAGSRVIKSPSQAAAERDEPPRTLLTAAVERDSLSTTLTFEAKTSPGARRTVQIADAVGKVVTGPSPRKGKPINPGDVVVTLNDRPVIALRSDYPMYRDLAVGDAGEDVARAQDALREAGFQVWDARGRFGDSTAGAVRALFDSAGFSVATAAAEPSAESPEESPAGASDEAEKPAPRRISLLRSEILMIPTLPTTLWSTDLRSGLPADKAELVCELSRPRIVAQVNPEDAKTLRPGMSVRYRTATSGRSGEGKVTRVGEARQTEDEGFLTRVTIEPSQPLEGSTGETVQVTTTRRQKQVGLVVPLSGIYASPSGATTVRVRTAGRSVTVEVQVLDTSDGRARVSAPKLKVGDRVLVGSS